MGTIENIKLEVITNSEDGYRIYLNNKNIDHFNPNYNRNIQTSTGIFLNMLLNTNYDKHKNLQEYLLENYLKDVEDMTNKEFADYLIENINGLSLHKYHVFLANNCIYNIRNDDINYKAWHNNLLSDAIKSYGFSSNAKILSKGNRKKFIKLVKQFVNYMNQVKVNNCKK